MAPKSRLSQLLVPIVGILGASSACAQSSLFTVFGDSASDIFGQDVDIVGDVNGDGHADVLVGAWRDDPAGKTDAGIVKVYSGLNGSLLWAIPGDVAGDHMGWRSSGAGDVDGDGRADFAAAADEADIAGMSNAGTVKIISGATGLPIWIANGNTTQDLFGWSSGAGGDIDGDGRDDVVVGALLDDTTGKTDCGSIRIVSGLTGAAIWTVFGDSSSDQLGYAVRGAGDVNQDGKDDFIGAAPGDDNTGSASGSARVYSGATGAPLFTVNGVAAGDATGGMGVSSAGDCDLDGFPDFVAGWSTADTPSGVDSGRVRVFSGATGLPLAGLTFTGDTANDRLGGYVRGAGDVTGDGYADIIAGATGDNGTGAVWVWSGKDGSLLYRLFGDSAGDAMGTSVGAGGDVNQDGFPDIMGGATGDDNFGASSGSARVWSPIRAGITHLFPGTPGCDGTQLLNGVGAPQIGNATFTIVSSNAPASSLNLLLATDASNDAGSDPFGIQATLYTDFFTATQVYGIDFPSDANGSCSIVVPIPNDSGFVGLTFTFQNLSAWPGPCAGLGIFNLSTSIGAKVTIAP